MKAIEKNQDLLKYAVENDIIDMSYVLEQVEMMRRKKILVTHPYSVWCGKNGKWYTYLPDEKKGRILKKRNTEKEIQDLIVEFYTSEEPDNKEQEECRKFSFEKCFETWREKQILYGLSPNTIRKYDADYRRFFENDEFEKCDIRTVNQEDIRIFMVRKVKDSNLKVKAAKSLWGYITGVFKSAQINHVIKDNPCKYIETKSFLRFCDRTEKTAEERTMSDSELELLLNRIKLDHELKPDYMPAYCLEFAMMTGMRSGEIAGLMWKNIDLKNRIIYVCVSMYAFRKSGIRMIILSILQERKQVK